MAGSAGTCRAGSSLPALVGALVGAVVRLSGWDPVWGTAFWHISGLAFVLSLLMYPSAGRRPT